MFAYTKRKSNKKPEMCPQVDDLKYNIWFTTCISSYFHRVTHYINHITTCYLYTWISQNNMGQTLKSKLWLMTQKFYLDNRRRIAGSWDKCICIIPDSCCLTCSCGSPKSSETSEFPKQYISVLHYLTITKVGYLPPFFKNLFKSFAAVI